MTDASVGVSADGDAGRSLTATSVTVTIAVDGSDADRSTCAAAHRLFADRARYVVVNVSDDVHSLGMVPLAYGMASLVSRPRLTRFVDGLDTAARDAEHVADDAAATAGLPEGTVAVGEVGDPVEVVLRVARELGADLVVVAASQRGWWSRMIDPSVSHTLVERADVPVMVVAP